MRNIWSAFVTAPTFADEDQTRNAQIAYIIILSTVALNCVSIVIDFLFSPASFDITLNLMTAVVQLVLIYWVRQGHVQLVGISFAVFGWLLITNNARNLDGLVNPIVALYVLPILFAGLLVSVRAGLAVMVICIITVITFAISAEAGDYPQLASRVALGTRLSFYVTLFGFTGVSIYLSMGAVKTALDRIRASETQLRERNLQLNAESEKREQAQNELRESELRWRFALDGGDTGIWDMNLETHEVFRSPRYLELLGYTPENVQDLPDLTSLIHPDDIEMMRASRDEFFKQPIRSYEHQMRLLCADGTYKWFLYRGNIIERKPDGEAQRFAGTLTDITAYKQMEETIKASEQGYRTLFENNPNPMWVFEKDTLRFIAVNDAAIALYGYPRDQFLSMTIRDIHPPDEFARFDDLIHAPKPLLSPPELWQHRTRDGRILLVEVTGHETIFQGKAARLILIRDMTTQKVTEESLRTSQDLFNRMFDSVPVGIAISRAEDGRYLSVNPHLAAMLDYQPQDMVGHTSVELNIVNSSDRTKHIEQVKSYNPTSTAVKLDVTLRARTGRSIDALTYTQQLKIDGDDTLLWIIVDVTSIKRTERERLQIDLLQSELDRQREIVELKENFISRVSHEFRSPLAIILSGTGILRLHDKKFTSEQRAERLEKIETRIYYLGNLLDNILTIAKPAQANFTLTHTLSIL